jgi:hypothetical protein
VLPLGLRRDDDDRWVVLKAGLAETEPALHANFLFILQ